MSCKKFIFLICMIFLAVNGECSTSFSLPTQSVQKREPELFIFVSFSMPEQSLKLWAEEVNRVGSQLLLRGFIDNDLQKTTAKTLALFGEEPNVELSVDPEKFQKFNIQVVPAVVIAESDLADSYDTSVPRFDVVYGDTSLEEALKQLSKTGSSETQKVAQKLLKQYRSGEHHD